MAILLLNKLKINLLTATCGRKETREYHRCLETVL